MDEKQGSCERLQMNLLKSQRTEAAVRTFIIPGYALCVYAIQAQFQTINLLRPWGKVESAAFQMGLESIPYAQQLLVFHRIMDFLRFHSLETKGLVSSSSLSGSKGASS
jgi:hypothetical protein